MKTFEELDRTPLLVEPGAPFICVDEKGLKQIQQDSRESAFRKAAKLIHDKIEAYQNEHGIFDHETGQTEYPKGGDEYLSELIEQEESILSLIEKDKQ